jgi:hypothetical protein
MTNHLQRIASLGSSALRELPPAVDILIGMFGNAAAQELVSLLALKNGFYAFEGALHVFPDLGNNMDIGLIRWNSDDLWRREYNDMTNGCIFFAEDAIGSQFCLKESQIWMFVPETGELELVAPTIEDWAQTILDDYQLWTAHSLVHAWQEKNGALPVGSRLVPKTPFVLGGEYSIDNLRAIDAVTGMIFRANLALQIRNLPDGAEVKLKIVD